MSYGVLEATGRIERVWLGDELRPGASLTVTQYGDLADWIRAIGEETFLGFDVSVGRRDVLLVRDGGRWEVAATVERDPELWAEAARAGPQEASSLALSALLDGLYAPEAAYAVSDRNARARELERMRASGLTGSDAVLGEAALAALPWLEGPMLHPPRGHQPDLDLGLWLAEHLPDRERHAFVARLGDELVGAAAETARVLEARRVQLDDRVGCAGPLWSPRHSEQLFHAARRRLPRLLEPPRDGFSGLYDPVEPGSDPLVAALDATLVLATARTPTALSPPAAPADPLAVWDLRSSPLERDVGWRRAVGAAGPDAVAAAGLVEAEGDRILSLLEGGRVEDVDLLYVCRVAAAGPADFRARAVATVDAHRRRLAEAGGDLSPIERWLGDLAWRATEPCLEALEAGDPDRIDPTWVYVP